MSKKIELLNSEGPILTAIKKNSMYEIVDQWEKTVAVLDEKTIRDFTRGDFEIIDSEGRSWIYSKWPGTMKPDLKKLDEFIGIDTSKFTY